MLSQSFFFQLSFYRDDLNHPTVSGNKLHKLSPNLATAKQRGCVSVLSFGGPYSNHLHALAFACKENGLASIGVVRGELHPQLTPTLKDCQAWGMRLIPMPRSAYRKLQTILQAEQRGNEGKCLAEVCLPAALKSIGDNTLVLPEGGSNRLAIDSLAAAYQPIFEQAQRQSLHSEITYAVCATGTGATVAGLYKAAPSNLKVIGVQAVSEGTATIERISEWLSGDDLANLSIVPGHLGGFAKTPPELLEFIQRFEDQYRIPLDPIYNGKVLFKLAQMAEQGFFTQKDKVLVVHTGGLQGKRK